MSARGAGCAAALVALAIAPLARADEPSFDLRAPMRAGFAYTGITRAPAFSFSLGLEADIAHVTRRLAITAVLDFDSASRPELSDKDPLSSFSALGVGAGLFYVTDGSVGLGFETTVSATFDAKDVAGAGVMTRAYVIPFYMSVEDAIKPRADRFAAWVRSSLSVWALARADWTSDGNGGSFAFGGAVDLMRVFFLPYLELLTKKLR
jgi:hypothetical protein